MSKIHKNYSFEKPFLTISLPTHEIVYSTKNIQSIQGKIISLSNDFVGLLKITTTSGSDIFHVLMSYEENQVERGKELDALLKTAGENTILMDGMM